MSNVENRPTELVCDPVAGAGVAELLAPRDVPLGGPRSMRVRRTLPQRGRSLIGAWCFCDHYGPDPVATSGAMSVAVHPHTGLQTVSWLFSGTIEHRDSAGNRALVRPGELNLMTAGSGISHSERSTPDTEVLHGVQLWVALPAAARFVARGFEHYVPPPVIGDGFTARVFLGELFGSTSPVRTHSPLLGAEISVRAGARLRVAVERSDEIGVLVDTGRVDVEGTRAGAGDLVYLPPGRDRVRIGAGDDPARLLLLGGPPFGEAIVMWWNFVGRSHEEIVAFREQWQDEIAGRVGEPMFALPTDDPEPPLAAPTLPNARIKPRS